MITKEQKQKLINLNDSRVNEVLGVIEYKEGKWYKNPESKFMVLIKEIIDDNNCYGYYFCGSEGIYKGLSDVGLSKCIEATNKEVEQKLIEEAKRRGYKNGSYECMVGIGTDEVDDDKFFYEDGILWNGVDGVVFDKIFDKGVWVEIKNPIKEKIEKLKQELKELKELEKLCK